MTSHTALSVSIGVLGGIAAALCLGPLSGIVLIWAVFITWACFFATGGDSSALINTIVCSLLGAVLAWIALIIILGIPLAGVLTLPIWAGIVIGLTVFIMCMLAQISIFSTLPASVLGYASVAAYALQTPNALSMSWLTSIDFDNALIVIGVSLIVGAVLGMISGKVAAAIGS
ncbi:MAG: DUF1097 domain-containing protein [Gammaproteobacteria bacterium]|nr:DUF1097 domain-containing protein [Gammaproteobacteria bacterium]